MSARYMHAYLLQQPLTAAFRADSHCRCICRLLAHSINDIAEGTKTQSTLRHSSGCTYKRQSSMFTGRQCAEMQLAGQRLDDC